MKSAKILASLLAITSLQADTFGLVGGEYYSGDAPEYAALLTTPSLTLNLFPNLPSTTNGYISHVALNQSGMGLLVGSSSSGYYAAQVTIDGQLIQILGGGTDSSALQAAAINQSGVGLIGGQEDRIHAGPAYAALVTASGTVTQLSGGNLPDSGFITSVAINNAGYGIIGGLNQHTGAYAALVAPNGTVTELTGIDFPLLNQWINSVDINNSRVGLIGGYDNAGPRPAYVALISPNGTVTSLSGGNLPTTSFGRINSVAINDSGNGLIGGLGDTSAYAALVAPDGTLTQLTGGNLSVATELYSVAINQSGAGLIGGYYFTDDYNAYAAIVAPDGTVTELSGANFPVGVIDSVAINEAGIGIIGGADYNTGTQPAYVALVAPNGTLTQLTGPDFPSYGEIYSVAINDAITPKSVGSYLGAINTQLAATFALESHLTSQNRPPKPNDNITLLASAEEEIPNLPCKNSNRTIWIQPFGNYIKQNAQGDNPSSTNAVGGILAAIEHNSPHFLIGGGLGYGYNYIHYGSSLGHGNVQEEMACLYTSTKANHLRLDLNLWGGYYQVHTERHTLNLITSTGHTTGWILSPHLGLATPFAMSDEFTIEPFALCDWVNSWQKHYTEKGSSGFNLVVAGHYGSLLRSEAGFRFYEEWFSNRGKFSLQQKWSYVNQTPFNFNSVSTAFIASASTFPVAIGTSEMQNLGAAEFRGSFVPWNNKYPYITIDLQAELGVNYQSYFAGLEIGKNF